MSRSIEKNPWDDEPTDVMPDFDLENILSTAENEVIPPQEQLSLKIEETWSVCRTLLYVDPKRQYIGKSIKLSTEIENRSTDFRIERQIIYKTGGKVYREQVRVIILDTDAEKKFGFEELAIVQEEGKNKPSSFLRREVDKGSFVDLIYVKFPTDENKTSSIVNTLTGINKALDQATKSKFASSGS